MAFISHRDAWGERVGALRLDTLYLARSGAHPSASTESSGKTQDQGLYSAGRNRYLDADPDPGIPTARLVPYSEPGYAAVDLGAMLDRGALAPAGVHTPTLQIADPALAGKVPDCGGGRCPAHHTPSGGRDRPKRYAKGWRTWGTLEVGAARGTTGTGGRRQHVPGDSLINELNLTRTLDIPRSAKWHVPVAYPAASPSSW